MSHNPDLITLKNCQYRRSRRFRAVKRLDIQTLVKVGGGSNLNFFLPFFFIRRHGKADTISLQRRCRRGHSKYPWFLPTGEGRRESLNRLKKSVNSNRGQQKNGIAGNATRQGDRTEPTAYQRPFIQSIVSLTTSLWRYLVKHMLITFVNTMLFLLEKCENCSKDCHILRQNIHVIGYL